MLAHSDFRNIRVACTVLQLSISRLLSSRVRPLRFISQYNSTPQPVCFHRGCAFAHLRGFTRTKAENFVCVIIPDTFNAGEFNNVLPNNETRPGTTHTNLRGANTQETSERFPGPLVLHAVIKRRVLG